MRGTGHVNYLTLVQIKKASAAKTLYFYYEDRNERADINEADSIKETVVEYSGK